MSHNGFPSTLGEEVKQQEIRNLNDSVLIRALPTGERMWDASHAEIVEAYPQHADSYRLERDADGYTRMQLHDVMRFFGGSDMPVNTLPIESGFKFAEDDEPRDLNDTVLVKVLPEGERMWDASHAEIVEAYPQHADSYRLERDADGYTRMQLHDVMRFFGGSDMPVNTLPIESGFKFA